MTQLHWLAVVGILFAQPRSSPATTTSQLYLYFGILIGSLLALAVVVFVMKRWYERNRKEDDEASEFLTEARELEEEGELTREEFLKIKARLSEGLTRPKSAQIKGGDPAKRFNPPRPQNPPDA
jgi:hypothetical protein